MTERLPLLVSTEWLSVRLDDPDLVVLDCSINYVTDDRGVTQRVSGREDYLRRHIPGAGFADLLSRFSDPDGVHPFTRPGVARLEAAAADVGISDTSTVIVYDTSAGWWATRLWWVLRANGFDRCVLLDGGLATWTREGRAVQSGPVRRPAGTFVARPRPGFFVDSTRVLDVVRGEQPGRLLNALSYEDFVGAGSGRPRAGRIPGSQSLPAAGLLSGDGHLLPIGQLQERVSEVVGDVDEGEGALITYCGGGISATMTAFALTLLGHERVSVYDGSLSEWSAHPDLPLVTGPADEPPAGL